MRYNDVIYLMSQSVTYDEYKNPITTTEERKVYANQMRVTTSERYEAANHGLKPSKRFEIYTFEYNGQSKLKHETVVYNITDVDERGEKIQLTCEKDVGS
ncbi:hypothetical protein Pryu01_03057 [Paraliobacillus ryukyuensis]|uniref:SPP1 family predicted phage head-tail adaptor n=1 Tax=Paraliobacillus ryukyuensis TaxID=200904 RepID=A0A366DSW2_9BACI|nr:phage head closure protein [Paraliobacillus ryukyuensis]RBO92288.1 SPP1 family predicted phage head-tail adaptor [Paraliobacillus ryukyuensis]